MFTQRFVHWLRQRVLELRLSWGARRAEARVPVASGSATASAGETPLAAHRLALSNWLDNGRRLRPRLVRRSSRIRLEEHIQQVPLSTLPAPSATSALPAADVAPRLSACGSALNAATPESATGANGANGVKEPPRTPSQPLPMAPATPATPATPAVPAVPAATTGTEHAQPSWLEGIEQLNEAQRRLVMMRQLVRQGIYNEGYAPDKLPPQYRHNVEDE